MMWLARFFLLYLSYSHAALDISITPKLFSSLPHMNPVHHSLLLRVFKKTLHALKYSNSKTSVEHKF